MKAGHLCTGGAEEHLGQHNTANACLAQCVTAKGAECKHSIFGTGDNTGKCYWQATCGSGLVVTALNIWVYRANRRMWLSQTFAPSAHDVYRVSGTYTSKSAHVS